MKRILASAIIIALSVTMSGCGRNEKKNVNKQKESSAVNVSVVEVTKKTIEDNVTYTGEIKAAESTSVSAKASGAATAVYKEVGDYVNAGEVLLKIDDTDYKNQYNQAVAAQSQAKAGYDQALAAYKQTEAAYQGALATYNSATNGNAEQTKLQLKSALDAATIEYNNAKVNYENQKFLYESGAISKTVYDAAVTRFENAKLNLETAKGNYDLSIDVILEESKTAAQANVDSAKAALDSAQAGVNSANANINSASVAVNTAQNAIDNTVVKAPISGYIASRNANKGQMVAPGVEIFSIKSTKVVEAQINVTESVIPNVKVGTKAVVNVKAADLKKVKGKVTSVSAVKNAQTGLYLVSIEIDNEKNLIKDGMFAEITLTLNDSASALVVPTETLLEDEKGVKYVYVAQGNKAVRVDVETGIATDELTEISKGLSKGDKVIDSGKDYLSETNNKIRIVK